MKENKQEKLFINYENVGSNVNWEKAEAIYKQNIDVFKKIIYDIMKKYNMDFNTARDSIIYELVFLQPNQNNVNSFYSKKVFKWFFIYVITMSSLVFNSIISYFSTLFEKKQKKVLLFEELWEDNSLYSRFYKYIFEQLPSVKSYALLYNTPSVLFKNIFSQNISGYSGPIINRRYRNLIYDFRIAITVMKKDFSYIFYLYKSSKEKNINFIYLYLRFLRKLLTYTSQVSNINSKILISACDYYWNPVKYFAYKKSIGHIILLQHNYKSTQMWNRLFEYSDIHFTHSNDASNKLIGNNFSERVSVGSFQLIPFLEPQELKYDILFINQTVHDDLMSTTPDLDQGKLIKEHNILISNFENYLKNYPNVKSVFIAKASKSMSYMKKKPANEIKEKLQDLNNIEFIESYGPSTFNLIKASKLVINMYSSLGFESYGLNKNVLWINYNRCCDSLGFDVENEDLHILISDNSYEAFESRVNLLLSNNNDVKTHFKKLKEKYMNISINPATTVANRVVDLIEA